MPRWSPVRRVELFLSLTLLNRSGKVQELEKRKLGRTNFDASIIGLGGEGLLRSPGKDKETYALINKALDLGINFFESARSYDCSEEYYGNALRERRRDVFLTSKSKSRRKEGALADLQETLKNMKTDYLDLWQVHDVVDRQAMDAVFAPGGAIEAFIEAKEKGYTRFIGIGGHGDPHIIKECLEHFDFDTMHVPVNPAEASCKSFLEDTMPLASEKNVGVIGMKIYVRGFTSKLTFYTSMEAFFRYALSQPIATAVISCDTMEQLEQNVYFARSFKAMDWEDQDGFVEAIAPYALMYYKSQYYKE
ncbi:MAG: putative oxidoreductase of aldo/keto reductase family [Deltaproteobacteria bacterium]|nr:putative oxidoreductase of aldo/keto reductase family [Deltaproteobacteria bacterium]